MQLAYLSGNNDDANFNVDGIWYTLHDGGYLEVAIADGTTISASVPSGDAGHASFNNNEICLCTRQYEAPQFYLFRQKPSN